VRAAKGTGTLNNSLCPKCGVHADSSDIFCNNCSAPLHPAEQGSTGPVAAYVAECRRRGISDDVIRQQLLGSGWQPQVVEAALGKPAVPRPASPDPSPETKAVSNVCPACGKELTLWNRRKPMFGKLWYCSFRCMQAKEPQAVSKGKSLGKSLNVLLVLILAVTAVAVLTWIPGSSQSRQVTAPLPSRSDQVVDVTLQDLLGTFGSGSRLTELQKENAYASRFKGKRVRTTIRADEVGRASLSSQYVVMQKSDIVSCTAKAFFPASQREKLAPVSVGSELTFTGRLVGYKFGLINCLEFTDAEVVSTGGSQIPPTEASTGGPSGPLLRTVNPVACIQLEQLCQATGECDAYYEYCT